MYILYIHGGMTFSKHEDYIAYLKSKEPRLEERAYWSGEALQEQLGEEYTILRPSFPNKYMAKYEEWKIIFENHLEAVDELIALGTSLGGVFLAKYLSEEPYNKKITKAIMVCPPYDDSLPDEELTQDFCVKDASGIDRYNATMFFAKNDPVVPVAHAKLYEKELEKTPIHILDVEGHFDTPSCPEIAAAIKKR